MIVGYNPIVLFIYFTSILLFTMFLQNPIIMAISLICGLLFSVNLSDNKWDFKNFLYNALLVLVITIINPLFSHNGVTQLFYINNNAVTLEAILYGLNIGLMIASVIYWFKCFNAVLTQEKILFLFSRISPKLALTISTALRFIPMLKEQSKKIKDSQKTMGLYANDNYLDRLKAGVRAFNSVTTYSLEKAIEMGQSMEARGYGLKHRTYYSNYKIRTKDILFLVFTLGVDIALILAKTNGYFDFSFYPYIKHNDINAISILLYLAFSLLCIAPTLINIKENLRWNYLKSKI